MSDVKSTLTETLRAHLICECGQWAENMDETVEHLADVLLALPGVAVTALPERPSEYWGPKHQPQWNHYPFARVDGDEIEIGARCEHIYRVNVAEARIHAANLLAATRVIESKTEVAP